MNFLNIYAHITKELLYSEWVENRLSQRQIAEKYNVPLSAVESRVKSFGLIGIRDKIKFDVKEDLFNIDNPVFCYFVGIVIADGYIDILNNRVVLMLTDADVLEVLGKYFGKSVPLPIYKFQIKGQKTTYKLSITSKYLVQILQDLGVSGVDKTSTVKMPQVTSKSNFYMLLRGIIDGDGNIRCKVSDTKGSLVFRLYSHSPFLTEGIVTEVIKWCNYHLTVSKHPTLKGNTIASREDFWPHLVKIYEEFPEICLQRKRETVKQIVNDIVHRYEMINHNNW